MFCFVLFFFFCISSRSAFSISSGVFFGFVEKAFLVCSPPAHQSLSAQFLLFPLLHFFFGFVLVFCYFPFVWLFCFLGLLLECLAVFLYRCVGMGTPYSWASITRISARNIGLRFKNQSEPEARVFSGYSGFLPHQNRPLPACVFLI